MLELLQLPLIAFAYLWNTVWTTAFSVVSYTFSMVMTVVTTLAPFATAALFFVSNETETKAVIHTAAAGNVPGRNLPALISSPEDGEWFSRFFEMNAETEKVKMQNKQIVLLYPKNGAAENKNRYIPLNFYSLNSK